MIKIIKIPLILLLLTSLTSKALEINESYQVSEAPEWIDSQTIPSSDKLNKGEFGVTYQLLERQVNYVGSTEDYFRLVYSVDEKEALAGNSQVLIDYYPDYQKLSIHQLNIIRNGRTLNALELDDITVAQKEDTEESLMLTGKVTASIQIRGLQVNDIIDYAYTVKGRNPIYDGKIFFRQSLGWGTTLGKLFFKVISPRELDIKQTAYQGSLKQDREGSVNTYHLSVSKIKAMKRVDAVPKSYSYFPYIQGSEFESWSKVVDWAKPHYSLNKPLQPELIKLVEQWRKETPNNKEKQILAAIKYVQDDIRYFGIELGVNSHKPHHPNTVFERRYGDCKDKTVLLGSLLAKLGISSYPAFVSTEDFGGFANFLPSPGVFNHVILRLEYENDIYYVDPTQSAKGGSLSSMSYLPYEKALVVDEKNKVGVEAIPLKAEQHSITVNESYKIEKMTEPALLTIKTVYKGVEADGIRSWYKVNSSSVVQDNYLNFYSKIYPGIEVDSSISIDDDRENNIVVISESYKVPQLWDYSSGYYYEDFTAHEVKNSIFYPEVSEREIPIGLMKVKNISHHIKVELPDGFALDESGDEVTFNTDDIIFKREVSKNENIYQVNFSYKIKDDVIQLGDISSYLAEVQKIYEKLNYRMLVPMAISEQKRLRKRRLKDLIGG